MKATLTAGVFTSRTDNWATPQALFDQLHKEFKFDLDVAASAENAKCDKYYTKRLNGLKQDWHGDSRNKSIFVNPPYGKQIGLWIEKAWTESQKGCTVVCVVPFRSDTQYFHDFVYNKCAEIRLVKGRLKYGASTNTSPFPTAILVYRPKGPAPNCGMAIKSVDKVGKLNTPAPRKVTAAKGGKGQ